MKNPNDPIRNQTRDLQDCSVVPQPTYISQSTLQFNWLTITVYSWWHYLRTSISVYSVI